MAVRSDAVRKQRRTPPRAARPGTGIRSAGAGDRRTFRRRRRKQGRRGIALFVNDPEVAQRYGFEKTEHGILLGTVIPALLTMTPPEPTEDDLRRHARAQADFTALPEVEKQLRESGKRWFSLGRGWHFRKDTEEVVVWLNPADQEEDQYGWYTLFELLQWADDEGPVKDVRRPKSPV